MSPEERALELFTRERRKTPKVAVFHLDNEENFAYYGQSLSQFDEFDDGGILVTETRRIKV